jgi:exodeoxyribonuclease-3
MAGCEWKRWKQSRSGRQLQPTMRIATWNVNSVRTRLDQVLTWLAEERPEVLCLQETKVADDLFPRQAFEDLGYGVMISGQKAYNGVAIVSRLPLEDVQIGFSSLLPGDPEALALGEQKRLISARIEGMRVLNLYVPNGSALRSEKYAYKLRWLACLGRYLRIQEEQGEPLLMVGDFNIALEDRDIHDPQRLSGGIMASEPERQALRSVLAERLEDGFRLFEPASGHWSWWDYRSGGWETGRGWRIDHIYLDAELRDRALACTIHSRLRGNSQPSDHAPVLIQLAWPPEECGEEGEQEEDFTGWSS